MAVSRTKSAQHKVYIPEFARENQYLLAKIKVTDSLLENFADLIDKNSEQPYQKFYQKLADAFFDLNHELEIESGQFIANDKFTRVRYSPVKIAAQTEQQIIFLYNHKYHCSQNAYFDGKKLAKSITLAFLANGDDIRVDSANFHKKVAKALSLIATKLNLAEGEIRLCDHQHLTYDLFAKDKMEIGRQTHRLRTITTRYLADGVELPEVKDASTYAIIDLTINKRIQNLVEINRADDEPYQKLYDLINDTFVRVAKKHNLHNGAVIANDLIAIVRQSEESNVKQNGELQMIGFNPETNHTGYTYESAGEKLVDTIQLVFMASSEDKTSHGYGKFLNSVQLALLDMADQLDYIKDKEEMVVRLHQHIGFNI